MPIATLPGTHAAMIARRMTGSSSSVEPVSKRLASQIRRPSQNKMDEQGEEKVQCEEDLDEDPIEDSEGIDASTSLTSVQLLLELPGFGEGKFDEDWQ